MFRTVLTLGSLIFGLGLLSGGVSTAAIFYGHTDVFGYEYLVPMILLLVMGILVLFRCCLGLITMLSDSARLLIIAFAFMVLFLLAMMSLGVSLIIRRVPIRDAAFEHLAASVNSTDASFWEAFQVDNGCCGYDSLVLHSPEWCYFVYNATEAPTAPPGIVNVTAAAVNSTYMNFTLSSSTSLPYQVSTGRSVLFPGCRDHLGLVYDVIYFVVVVSCFLETLLIVVSMVAFATKSD